MYKASTITVDASKAEKYSFNITIDTSKPFATSGGNSYSMTTSVELPNGNRIRKLGNINFKNVCGICSYKIEGQGKANIIQRTSDNPGVASFISAYYEELVRACEEAKLTAPKPYISVGAVDKDDKPYPDTIFTKVNIESSCDFIKAYIAVREDEDSEYQPLLGEEQVDQATIRSYANKCIKDSSVKDLLNKVYGVKVTIDKSKKASIVFPDKLTNNKKLLETTEFADRIKEYGVVAYQAKFNNLFIKGAESFCTFISHRVICDVRVSVNQEAEEEFDSMVKDISKVKINTQDPTTVEDVDAEDPLAGM